MSGFSFNWGAARPDPITGAMGTGAGVATMAPIAQFGRTGITAPVLGSLDTPWSGPMAGISLPTTAAGGVPGGVNSQMFGGGLGMNMDTARLALSGIGTLGGLWGAFQAANLAKKQFNYTRDVTETNLANQIKTFNTSLTDRANNRAIVEGRTPAETQAYIDTNKLSRYGRGG